MRTNFILILLFLFSEQIYCQWACEGTYISKNTGLGMFTTKIQLNADGTFTYDFKGDLAHNWGSGKFVIDTDNVLVLIFRESDLDASEQASQAISGGREIFEKTMSYVCKGRKMFPLLESGKVDRNGRLIRRKSK